MNELVSNSLKYSFQEGRSGKIQIKLHRDVNDKKKSLVTPNRNFMLIVEDNGIGFPDSIDFRNTSSLGLQLVNTLVDQINGDIELIKDSGTKYNIRFTDSCT
nr:sensor histidine kinase [Methanosarcina barkeri]